MKTGRIVKWLILMLALYTTASKGVACETPKCVNCTRKEFSNYVAACALNDINAAVLRNFQNTPGNADCLTRFRNDHMEPLDGCVRDAVRDNPNAQYQVPLMSILNGAAIQVGGRNLNPSDRNLVLLSMYAGQLQSPNPALVSALNSAGFNPRPYLEAVRQLSSAPKDARSTYEKIKKMPIDIRRMVLENERQSVMTVLDDQQTAMPFITLVIETLTDPDDLLEFIAKHTNWAALDPTVLDMLLKAIRKSGNPPLMMSNSLCFLTDLVDRSRNLDAVFKENQGLFVSLNPAAQKGSAVPCYLAGGKFEPKLSGFYARVTGRLLGSKYTAAPTIQFVQAETAARCANSDLASRVKDYLYAEPRPANSNAFYNDSKGCTVNLTFARQGDGSVAITVSAPATNVNIIAPKPNKDSVKDDIEKVLKQLPWGR